jgi:hypothetical protein
MKQMTYVKMSEVHGGARTACEIVLELIMMYNAGTWTDWERAKFSYYAPRCTY